MRTSRLSAVALVFCVAGVHCVELAQTNLGATNVKEISNQLCCGNIRIQYDPFGTENVVDVYANSMSDADSVSVSVVEQRLLLRSRAVTAESPMIIIRLVLGTALRSISSGSGTKMLVRAQRNSPIGIITATNSAMVKIDGTIYPLRVGLDVTASSSASVCLTGVECGSPVDQCTGITALNAYDDAKISVLAGDYPDQQVIVNDNGAVRACNFSVVQSTVRVDAQDTEAASASLCVRGFLQANSTGDNRVSYAANCTNALFQTVVVAGAVTELDSCESTSDSSCELAFQDDLASIEEQITPCDRDQVVCEVICFAASSRVDVLKQGAVVSTALRDVRAGDLVQSFDDAGAKTFSEVFLVQHVGGQLEPRPMFRVVYSAVDDADLPDGELTASHSHYVLSAIEPKRAFATVGSLRIGSTIFVLAPQGDPREARVVDIEPVFTAAVNIHTLNDRVVVDNVLASCIASVKVFGWADTMSLRWLLLPLKILYLMGTRRLVAIMDHAASRLVLGALKSKLGC